MSLLRRSLMMAQGGKKEIPNYLCFTALEDGEYLFTIPTELATTDLTRISYSKDGVNFTTVNNSDSEDVSFSISVDTGDKVYFKGLANRYNNGTDRVIISSDCDFNVSGNILSLIFEDDFYSATDVDLSANKYNSLFRALFYNCRIVYADNLELPISKISNYGFYAMFAAPADGNHTLILPPEVLPLIFIGTFGCSYMFSYQTNMTTMPDLSSFGSSGFRPNLRACNNMFQYCSSLQYFTPIPYVYSGRSGADGVFSSMFRNCTSLKESPFKKILGADNNSSTFGGTGQCNSMFICCSNLEEVPELPLLTLKGTSYSQMFRYDCSKVNYIKMLATSVSASNCLQRWVEGVAATGVFVKNINATWNDTGHSGVPTNWTIIYYDPAEDKYYTDQTRTTECDDRGNPI